MKRIVCILLIFALILALSSCDILEPKDIRCDEIIEAYKDTGYSNVFHLHSDGDYQISGGEECYIIIHETEDDDSDLAEIRTFYTEEEAVDAAEFDNYNLARWMIAVMYGEGRWLESGSYGKIEYSSYNKELLKPLKALMV